MRSSTVALLVALASCASGATGGSSTTAPGLATDAGSAPTNAAGTIAYGDSPEQIATLGVPEGIRDGERFPVVVLLHGGFWRARYRADLMEPLADDLVERGYVTWNVEYRKVGEPGGGYPGTLDDVAAAIDHLAILAGEGEPIDLDRVVVVGHSAGGHLSLWSATRDDPAVKPMLVVGLAPVADLVDGANARLGDGAVIDFIGATPDEAPDAYAAASPAERLPGIAPQLIVQGSADSTVGVDFVRRYVARAEAAGTDVRFELVEGADHFDVIDPTHESWKRVAAALPKPSGP